MPVYEVYALVQGSKYIGSFEAESEEEAIGVAQDTGELHIGLCHQCSDQMDDPEIVQFDAYREWEGAN